MIMSFSESNIMKSHGRYIHSKSKRVDIPIYELILIIAVIVYIFSWSVIDILRLMNLQDSVFDSGIISLTMNTILFEHPLGYVRFMIGFSLLRIIFSPLILIDGITGMLVIQEIFLALPAIVLYKIFLLRNDDKFSALLISSSYLLYFPLAGVNLFDFHFQAFFMLFFLLGYYFFMKKKYALSTILFFFSGIVRFPYLIFPLILMVALLAGEIYNMYVKGYSMNKRKFNYIMVSFTIFIIMLIASYFLLFKSPYEYYQSFYLGGYFHITSGSFFNIFFSDMDNKIITIVLILAPLLFIPLRSKKWMVLLLPFIVLSFLNAYGVYIYPGAFHYQYMVTVAPFMFLGLIETINIGQKSEPQQNTRMDNSVKRILSSLRKNYIRRKEPIAVFIAIVLFAIIFQPYSPLNAYSSDPFEMNILHPDTCVYDEYKNITDLIPTNNPYVIYQNDLPLVDVHDHALSCLAAFNVINGFNYSLSYYLYNLTLTHRVDYAMGYIQGFASGPQLTMCQAMNKLYEDGNYGIEAYENGFILLSRDYSGKPVYFKPIDSNAVTLSVTNTAGNVSIVPQFSLLIPGTYELTITSSNGTIQNPIQSIHLSNRNYEQNFTNVNVISSRTGNNYTYKTTLHISYFMFDPFLEVDLPKNDMNKSFAITLDENPPT